MFEKRMELLNKSYKKIPAKSDATTIIKAIKEEQPPKKKRPFIHWPYVASFIGVLLIGTVLVLQLTLEDPDLTTKNGNQSQMMNDIQTELLQEIKEAKGLYDIRKIQAMEGLGFSEAVFSKTSMAKEAQQDLTYITSLPKSNMSVNTKIRMAKSAKDRINETLTIPSVMMKNMKTPLNQDEAEQWTRDFIEKQRDIFPLYEEILEGNKNLWKKHIENGKLNMNKFNDMSSNDYGRFWIINGGINNNGVKLTYDMDEDQLNTSLDYVYFNMFVDEKFLPNPYKLYINASLNPIIEDGEFNVSWEDAMERLMQYERILKELPKNSRFQEEVKLQFDHHYYFIVNGGVSNSIFTKENKLKPEVKKAYKYVMEKYPHYQTTGDLKKVYSELKELDFKKPENWVQHTPAIVSSELESNSPEEMDYNMSPLHSDEKLMDIYNRFSQSHRVGILEDLSIFDVARLYLFTLSVEDLDSEYELYAKESLSVDEEMFKMKNQNRKEPLYIIEGIDGMSYMYDGESDEVIGVNLHYANGDFANIHFMREDQAWKVLYTEAY